MIENRLSVKLETATGETYRLGADEFSAENIPQDWHFTSTLPGGFDTASIRLPRRVGLDWPDLDLFNLVTIYGAGNEVVWKGRIAQLPRSRGAGEAIEIGCVGLNALLRDDPSFMEVYVDRDLSHWQGPSTQRIINVLGGTAIVCSGPSVQADHSTGFPALQLTLPGAATAGNRMRAEAWYDAGPGVLVDVVYYNYLAIPGMGANRAFTVGTSDDDILTTSSISADKTVGNEAAYRDGTNYRFVQFVYKTIADISSTDNNERPLVVREAAVYGDHGLTRVVDDDDGDPAGVIASDVVQDVVTRAAPGLAIDEIAATSFVIPHLEFHEPVTAEDAIKAANRYDLYEWGVYDRGFFYRPTDEARALWEVRLSEGADLQLEGVAGDQVFNGVVVVFDDPAGRRRMVGPPESNTDTTSTDLVDDDPSNPATAHGLLRKWGVLQIDSVATNKSAIQIGAAWLAAQQIPQRRGMISLAGSIAEVGSSGMRPAWAVRAGDYVRIADHSSDVARRVIETNYDVATERVSLTLENPSFRMDAILERFATLIGVSS